MLLARSAGSMTVDERWLAQMFEPQLGRVARAARWRRFAGRSLLSRAQAARVHSALEEVGVSATPSLVGARVPESVVLTLVPTPVGEPPSQGGIVAGARAFRTSRAWRVAKPVGGLITFGASVLGIVLGVAALTKTAPSPSALSGDLNVAVTPFETTSASDRRAGLELAGSLDRLLSSTLSSRLGHSLDIQVRGPDRLEPVRGATRAERLDAAAKLAHSLGADVVVGGRIDRVGRHAEVVPTIYISPGRLKGAEELGGEYSMGVVRGGSVSLDKDLAARTEFRLRVTAQLNVVGAFATGLASFQAGRYSAAVGWFAKARRWAAHRSTRAAALALLFEGHAQGRLGHIDAAAAAFREALVLRHRWPRARLGLAEAAYHRASNGCQPPAAEAPLRHARADFLAIERAARGSDLSTYALRVRASLGVGRVDLCLWTTQFAENRALGARELRETLQMIGGQTEQFPNEAADAHAGLGLATLPVEGQRIGVREAFLAARKEYATARDLTTSDARARKLGRSIRDIDKRLEALRLGGNG